MNYTVHTPHPLLAQYIRCYWILEDKDPAPSRDRIFPDGCCELVFHFGDVFRKYRDDSSFYIQPRALVHGQLKKFMDIEATGSVGIFGVRFHPAGLSPFVRENLPELSGLDTDLHSLWGKEGDTLQEKVLNASSHGERIRFIESFLLKRLRRAKTDDRLAEHCVRAMQLANGNIPVARLADDLNIGRRHLERKFVSSVGVTPKMLSRILRFQNALQAIEIKRFNNLTILAYEAGFYDQAHFIRDFKEFTGMSPGSYFAEDLELSKLFTAV